MKKLILLASSIILSACGTTGMANMSALSEPIPSGQSRIIVSRNNSLLYLAGAADISLDGKEIASLARGGSVVENIPIGKHTLSVNAPMTFGNYTSAFEAKPGKTYTFEISPNRNKSIAPGILLGAFGEAAEAQVSENTGYFQIKAVNVE